MSVCVAYLKIDQSSHKRWRCERFYYQILFHWCGSIEVLEDYVNQQKMIDSSFFRFDSSHKETEIVIRKSLGPFLFVF